MYSCDKKYMKNILKMDVLNGNYRLTLHLHCLRKLMSDVFLTKYKHFATNKQKSASPRK